LYIAVDENKIYRWDGAAGTVPAEGADYKVLWPQATDFTAIAGYDAATAQTLQHDASGNLS
jgi:hypothetical protein